MRSQWSSLFQRLIHEQRQKVTDSKRLDNLTEKFEDLKAAILNSMGDIKEREVAKAVVKYRRLLNFVRALGMKDLAFLAKKHSWDTLLKHVQIDSIEDLDLLMDKNTVHELKFIKGRRPGRQILYLKKVDGTFFEFRGSFAMLEDLMGEWNSFMELAPQTRSVVFEALSDTDVMTSYLRYIPEQLETYAITEGLTFNRSFTG
ncbi:hypothetical protein [Pseudomonas sp. LB3P38]|uniref:hypothetical protein n=1 Tax=Pseudomonas lyxosi TaxID=3398358 RepID=UPI0039EE7BEE